MTTVPNLSGGTAENLKMVTLDLRSATVTLGGDTALSIKSAPIQVLDPGGTHRDVTLPAEASSDGLVFIIVNAASSTENLLVKNDSGTLLNTLTGVSGATANARGQYVCDGSTWFAMHMTEV